MPPAQYVFWHQAPYIINVPYMEGLAAALPKGAVLTAFTEPISQRRKAMGWNTPNLERCEVFWLNEKGCGDEVLARSSQETIHVFSTVLNSPDIARWFSHVRMQSDRVFLTSEWRDWRGPKGLLRRIDSLRRERHWQPDLAGVFAMGALGERWFRMCGYDPEKVFPFCYVVAPPDKDAEVIELHNDRANLVFVGSLDRRKRIDLALRALSKVNRNAWNLRLVGDGPERPELEALATDCGIGDQVKFMGFMENTLGRAEIAAADVLLLPSQEDGWGAVVNEALMVGTPAICSDACGAADLIRSPSLGSVFGCGKSDQLTGCLDTFMDQLEAHRASRRAVCSWAKCLEGESVGEYIIQCAEWAFDRSGEKPIAPWRKGAHFGLPDLEATHLPDSDAQK